MTDEATPDERPRLIPADPDELRKAISFALQFNGRKRNHYADTLAADITADHLARALEKGNYIVMRKPTPTPPATWPPAPRNSHLTD
jgi:Zn-dependent protease with chaperone function